MTDVGNGNGNESDDENDNQREREPARRSTTSLNESEPESDSSPSIPAFTRRAKSAALWGAVGFMSFLVLLQGYALYDGPALSIAHGAAFALLVGVVAGTGAYALEYRVAEWAAKRNRNRKHDREF